MDRELINEWFRFANMDLDLAKHTFETMHPSPLEIICYHCQQAAEKFIKGVIVSFDIEVEKTHDLSKLFNTLSPFDLDFSYKRVGSCGFLPAFA